MKRPEMFRLSHRVTAEESGERLVEVVAGRARRVLGPLSRSRIRAAIVAGVARVDGRIERAPGRPLLEGQRLEVLLRRGALEPAWRADDRPSCLGPEAVLYRDRFLIAIAKPPGLPTHATADPSRPHLVALVQALLAAEGRPPYVAVHQRLDRDTSGVVLFAIDRAANAPLAHAFASREVHKAYLVLTERPAHAPPRRFRISLPLDVADRPSARGRVRVGGRDARPAETVCVVRELLASALLLEARTTTGRKHQIRAHLAHAGLPVLGDRVYGRGAGAGPGSAPRTMLHAWRLSLTHPVTGRRLEIESPVPEDFAALAARGRRGRPKARS